MSLSDKQRRVVECMTNCLAVACPGSGKTRVLAHKVKHILEVDSGAHILIVSFTQDSAAEIKKRVLKLVPGADNKIATGTFHSLSFTQLKRDGFNGTVLSSGQMKSYIERALKECLKDCLVPELVKEELVKMDLNEAVSLIEHLKMTPGYVSKNDLHGFLYSAYAKLTKRNNVIDFSDMLSLSVSKMMSGEIEPINCSHILIDESQDLDEMQYAWSVEHIKRKGAVFTVVGDDDQSIYKFRRALGYKGMMRFKDDFGADLIMLDTNYRSYSEILGAAGKVIEYNDKKHRVEKELSASRGKGGVTEAWQCESAGDEANLVIAKIKELSAGNPVPPPIKMRARDDEGTLIVDAEGLQVMTEYHYSVGVLPNEWAVFARNNFTLKVLAAAMRANFIPHKFAGTNLWSERPVCFVIALLMSLVTKKKEGLVSGQAGYDSALHFAGLDEELIEQLHVDYGGDFTQMLHDQELAEKYGRGTAATLTNFNKHVADWLREISYGRPNMAINGVFNWFLAGNSAYNGHKKDKGLRDYNSLMSCKTILTAMNGSIMVRISQLLGPEPEDETVGKNEKDALKKEKDEKKKAKEDLMERRVSLGTLHSSKGLEFDNVWLFSVDDGVIPDLKEWTPEIQEEERRLFYVGMTRAKDRLFISCGQKPSSFIEETGIPLKMNLGPGEHVLKAASAT